MNDDDLRFELKPLSKAGVKAALEKAHHYRLLNERREAASIARDVLEVDPENQEALVLGILALSDLFRDEMTGTWEEAKALIARLEGEYQRAYYSGILCERRAKAIYQGGAMGCGPAAFEGLREAMNWYEQAEAMRPAGNDDALLRWNTCARMIMQHGDLRPAPVDGTQPFLE